MTCRWLQRASRIATTIHKPETDGLHFGFLYIFCVMLIFTHPPLQHQAIFLNRDAIIVSVCYISFAQHVKYLTTEIAGVPRSSFEWPAPCE